MDEVDRVEQKLVSALEFTRSGLEVLIAQLLRIPQLSRSVTEEQHLRRARRALRTINNRFLPLVRQSRISSAQAAEVVYKLSGYWADLPLNADET
jgi:hypothetical protein